MWFFGPIFYPVTYAWPFYGYNLLGWSSPVPLIASYFRGFESVYCDTTPYYLSYYWNDYSKSYWEATTRLWTDINNSINESSKRSAEMIESFRHKDVPPQVEPKWPSVSV
jgi:hypothetical protein